MIQNLPRKLQVHWAFATANQWSVENLVRATKTERPVGREVARSNNDYGTECEE
jgi:hypothetical protein